MATGGTEGVSDLKGGGEETFDLCVICKGKNKNTEADKFCSECHDYCCSSSVKCHDVIPTLKHHQILDKSTAPLPAVPTERCKEHKDKSVDMYCKNHNVVGCPASMLVKHSFCQDKLYIPDFIEDNTSYTNTKDVEENLEKIAKSITKLQEALMEEQEDLKDNKDMLLKEIGSFREKINQLLDQFEKNIVQELELRFKTGTDRIDSSLGELQAKTTELKAAQDRLRSTGGNMPQKFVSMMQANQVVSNAKENGMTSENEFSHTELYFLKNKKLQTLFSEIQDLGSISLRVRKKTEDQRQAEISSESEV